jgi:CheY-like chemotaxis protein
MRILFIDDERQRMEPYVWELEDCNHEVVFQDNVDTALETLHDPNESFDMVVLDISMPPGTEYNFEETVGGIRTGILLYAKIRSLRPDLKVVALTNVPYQRLAKHFEGEDTRLYRFVRKQEKLPIEFAKLVGEFLSETHERDVP